MEDKISTETSERGKLIGTTEYLCGFLFLEMLEL